MSHCLKLCNFLNLWFWLCWICSRWESGVLAEWVIWGCRVPGAFKRWTTACIGGKKDQEAWYSWWLQALSRRLGYRESPLLGCKFWDSFIVALVWWSFGVFDWEVVWVISHLQLVLIHCWLKMRRLICWRYSGNFWPFYLASSLSFVFLGYISAWFEEFMGILRIMEYQNMLSYCSVIWDVVE